MDAFYASVEALDDPSLAGKPLIVGGTGRRGVVASCSYEARVFGVRSAMPSGQARRLCPNAIFVPGRYGRYAEVSRQMHEIFQRFTPLVEGISLDEAFLDVTGAIRLFGTPFQIGSVIRDAVREELGLSCSVGGATVKFLAKLASEAAKPRVDGSGSRAGPGVFIVEPGMELQFLHPHAIEALWGVGPATAKRLRQLGMATIGDLARVESRAIEAAVGKAAGAHLARLARGVDERSVEPHREVKSVSHEETYAVDRRDEEGLRVEVIRMGDAVASRLRQAGLAGRTVTLKIRYGDFSTRTRSVTSPVALDDGRAIAHMGCSLLAGLDLADGVRLLGVGVSNLLPAGAGPGEPLALDLAAPAQDGVGLPTAGGAGGAGAPGHGGAGGADGPGRDQPDDGRRRDTGGTRIGTPSRRPSRRSGAAPSTTAAVDAIRRRFGAAAVGPAALLGSDGLRVKRQGDTQWGPTEAPRASPESAGETGEPPNGAPPTRRRR